MDRKPQRWTNQSKMRQEEYEERKEKAKAKAREKHWELMRCSIEYLKQNETKWRNVRG